MTSLYFRGQLILDFLILKYKALKDKRVYINSKKYKCFTDVIFQNGVYEFDEQIEGVVLVEKKSQNKRYDVKKVLDLSDYFEMLDIKSFNIKFKPVDITELNLLKKIFENLIKNNKKILYLHPKTGEYNLLLLVLMRLYRKGDISISGEIDRNYFEYIREIFKEILINDEMNKIESYDVIISEKDMNIEGFDKHYYYLYFYFKNKNNKNYKIKCPVCKSLTTLYFKKKNEQEWFKCSVCAHTFVKEVKDNYLVSFYENYNEKRAGVYPFIKERVNEMCLLFDVNKANDILEIGAGNGEMLLEFKKRGKNVTAVEIDKYAIEVLKSNGIKVYKNLEEINKQFDLIYSFHTVEHIKDIEKLYENINRHLKFNGIIFTHIPCSEIDYWIEDHLHIFSLESITLLHKKFFQNYKYLVRNIISSAGVYTPVVSICSIKEANVSQCLNR